ncbi:MAG: NAD(P)-dependent oxidoreductase [Elusimicrobiaceae bacterium]|nr:NAD(P)-dependent oxidoreductase [Elusimicrobiaceae bacterium]
MNYFKNKTILVTGATGLIGSNLVHTLMNFPNVHLLVLGRSNHKLMECFHHYLNLPNFQIIAQDISKPLIIEKPIDIIFHAAGPMENYIINHYPLDVINPNIMGTTNCLELLKNQQQYNQYPGKIIIFSSVTVYSNPDTNSRCVTEDDTAITSPISDIKSCYSQSKRMAEIIAQAYHTQYGIDFVSARLSTVYGYTYFIPDTAFFHFIKTALQGNNINLNASTFPRRDNIYIQDAISGLLFLAQYGISGQAYNLSSNAELNNFAAVDEIAHVIASQINDIKKIHIQVNYQFKNTNIDRSHSLCLDNSKLKNLGWKLRNSLQDGICQTIQQIIRGNAIYD